MHDKKKAKDRKRKEIRGRLCRSCQINDSEVESWSFNNNYCVTCARRRHPKIGSPRNKPDEYMCSCLRVKKRYGLGWGKPASIPLCSFCDTAEFEKLGLRKTILIHWEDDRERWIWRSVRTCLPEVLAATPEQWKSWR